MSRELEPGEVVSDEEELLQINTSEIEADHIQNNCSNNADLNGKFLPDTGITRSNDNANKRSATGTPSNLCHKSVATVIPRPNSSKIAGSPEIPQQSTNVCCVTETGQRCVEQNISTAQPFYRSVCTVPNAKEISKKEKVNEPQSTNPKLAAELQQLQKSKVHWNSYESALNECNRLSAKNKLCMNFGPCPKYLKFEEDGIKIQIEDWTDLPLVLRISKYRQMIKNKRKALMKKKKQLAGDTYATSDVKMAREAEITTGSKTLEILQRILLSAEDDMKAHTEQGQVLGKDVAELNKYGAEIRIKNMQEMVVTKQLELQENKDIEAVGGKKGSFKSQSPRFTVCHIPPKLNESENLLHHFMQFGEVHKLLHDAETKTAIVEYEKSTEAIQAVGKSAVKGVGQFRCKFIYPGALITFNWILDQDTSWEQELVRKLHTESTVLSSEYVRNRMLNKMREAVAAQMSQEYIPTPITKEEVKKPLEEGRKLAIKEEHLQRKNTEDNVAKATYTDIVSQKPEKLVKEFTSYVMCKNEVLGNQESESNNSNEASKIQNTDNTYIDTVDKIHSENHSENFNSKTVVGEEKFEGNNNEINILSKKDSKIDTWLNISLETGYDSYSRNVTKKIRKQLHCLVNMIVKYEHANMIKLTTLREMVKTNMAKLTKVLNVYSRTFKIVLKDGIAYATVRPDIDLCEGHCSSQHCKNEKCPNLHLCKYFYIDQPCQNKHSSQQFDPSWKCNFGHKILGPSNAEIINKHFLSNLESRLQRSVLRQRRTFATVPKVCKHYNFETGCRHSSTGDGCCALHVCKYYIRGTCNFGVQGCIRSHDLMDKQPCELLKRHGLDPSSQQESIRKKLQDLNTIGFFIEPYKEISKEEMNVLPDISNKKKKLHVTEVICDDTGEVISAVSEKVSKTDRNLPVNTSQQQVDEIEGKKKRPGRMITRAVVRKLKPGDKIKMNDANKNKWNIHMEFMTIMANQAGKQLASSSDQIETSSTFTSYKRQSAMNMPQFSASNISGAKPGLLGPRPVGLPPIDPALFRYPPPLTSIQTRPTRPLCLPGGVIPIQHCPQFQNMNSSILGSHGPMMPDTYPKSVEYNALHSGSALNPQGSVPTSMPIQSQHGLQQSAPTSVSPGIRSSDGVACINSLQTVAKLMDNPSAELLPLVKTLLNDVQHKVDVFSKQMLPTNASSQSNNVSETDHEHCIWSCDRNDDSQQFSHSHGMDVNESNRLIGQKRSGDEHSFIPPNNKRPRNFQQDRCDDEPGFVLSNNACRISNRPENCADNDEDELMKVFRRRTSANQMYVQNQTSLSSLPNNSDVSNDDIMHQTSQKLKELREIVSRQQSDEVNSWEDDFNEWRNSRRSPRKVDVEDAHCNDRSFRRAHTTFKHEDDNIAHWNDTSLRRAHSALEHEDDFYSIDYDRNRRDSNSSTARTRWSNAESVRSIPADFDHDRYGRGLNRFNETEYSQQSDSRDSRMASRFDDRRCVESPKMRSSIDHRDSHRSSRTSGRSNIYQDDRERRNWARDDRYTSREKDQDVRYRGRRSSRY